MADFLIRDLGGTVAYLHLCLVKLGSGSSPWLSRARHPWNPLALLILVRSEIDNTMETGEITGERQARGIFARTRGTGESQVFHQFLVHKTDYPHPRTSSVLQ